MKYVINYEKQQNNFITNALYVILYIVNLLKISVYKIKPDKRIIKNRQKLKRCIPTYAWTSVQLPDSGRIVSFNLRRE